MKATLKAEFLKLFSVRSTYIVSALTWIFIAIFAFWVEGYKGLSGSVASQAGPQALEEIFINAGSTVAGFASIIAVLFVIHEYRYNMIMYTLTASNSRSKVLFAKLFAATAFTIGFTALSLAFATACYLFGLSLRDATLVAQDWNIWASAGRVLFYNLSYAWIGLMVGLWTRNIAAAIASLFLVPNTLEPILGLLIKENAVYLPFAALERVITTSISQTLTIGSLAPEKAIAVASAYILPAMLFTWWLFRRRDAA